MGGRTPSPRARQRRPHHKITQSTAYAKSLVHDAPRRRVAASLDSPNSSNQFFRLSPPRGRLIRHSRAAGSCHECVGRGGGGIGPADAIQIRTRAAPPAAAAPRAPRGRSTPRPRRRRDPPPGPRWMRRLLEPSQVRALSQDVMRLNDDLAYAVNRPRGNRSGTGHVERSRAAATRRERVRPRTDVPARAPLRPVRSNATRRCSPSPGRTPNRAPPA